MARPVPGASVPRFANCRPLSGRFSISFSLTTVPMAGVVATSGASAVTVICSATGACLSVTLMFDGVATCTSTPRVVTVVKPESSAVTLYGPTGADGKV